ncbi:MULTISPECIES: hypothetical protein [Limnospira]|uniref:hypothetical protein n=1 Tax=Limnospira TaxID=2596745 RepID=UPI0002804073|nr:MULTISPECIES: hypothetical protein [unclassified Limnospira]EKD09613.1 hypothetical protein SPLC1_S170620 [Arthrospira platensis C1]MDT9234503.1 hypothetical protein [Limnospira sp. PMC 917.15]MDT9275330.1 hypothetical protein [Limnospira sp. PMC 737.11]UWU45434.1 hypothetical protein APLC1_0112 [Arthrospira platensis C1]
MSHQQHHQHQHQHQHHDHNHDVEKQVNPIIAKLKAIAQPRVWGPIGVISLVSIFVWEVSENPELYRIDWEPETSESGLSPEELAIAAEIDSSGLLLEELRRNNPEDVSLFNNPIQGGEDVFEEVRRRNSRSDQNTQTQSSRNLRSSEATTTLPEPFPETTATSPFNATSQALQNAQNSPNNRPASFGLLGWGTPANQEDNQETLTNSPLAPTPLQAAMGQSFSSSTSESEGETQTQTQGMFNPLIVTGSSNSQVATPSSTNGDNNTASGIPLPAYAPPVQIPEASWVVPRTVAPIDGTNAATVDVAPNQYQTNRSLPQPLSGTQPGGLPPAPVLPPNRANPHGQYNYTGTNPFGRNQQPQTDNSGGFPNFQPATPNPNNYVVGPTNLNPNNQNQVIQQQAPFTSPRSTPGRVIGGGRINSFSNP